MSIFPRPLKKVLGKIIPFSKEDKVPTFNLGDGVADNTTFLRGDGTWSSPASSGYVPYTGATQNVNLGDYKITADAVAFDLTPVNAPAAGQIAYDGASGALAYLLNSSNVISRIGQTMHAYVHNAESVTITKGQAVYLFSASGNKASVKLAYNTSDATSAKTFGLAAEDIPAGNNGMVICQGVLDGLNTGMYTAGDTLYLGATAGTYTATKPYAPNHLVYIGIVERANNGNGQIYVKTQNGYELDELHDVDLVTTPPVNGNVLGYNGSLWIPINPPTGITVGTTPITSGTDGRILFQAGGVVQQDSGLFWDNTNKRLGVGATPSTSVRIDVRAQGALSTDIIFRTRNSSDTRNFLTVNGAGDVFNNGAGGVTTNTFYGENVGRASTGSDNSFYGLSAGQSNTSGINNSFFGRSSGVNNTTGNFNSFFGRLSGNANSTGFQNTFTGNSSGQANTTADGNSFYGSNTGESNTTGRGNSFYGQGSGQYATTGNFNSFFGRLSGRLISSGANLTIAHNSLFLGYDTRANADNETNQIVIGHNAIGLGSNTVVLGNSSIVTTQLRGTVRLSLQASAPAGVEGAIYYDSTTKKHYGHDGTTWNALY